MHLSRRVMLSLLGGVAAVSMIFAIYQAAGELHALRENIQGRAVQIGKGYQGTAQNLVEDGSIKALLTFVNTLQNNEQLARVRVYDEKGEILAASPYGPSADVEDSAATVKRALETGRVQGQFYSISGLRMHVLAWPLSAGTRTIGALAVFQNAPYAAAPILRHSLASAAQTLVIVGVTLLIFRWSLLRNLKRMTQWLQELRSGKTSSDFDLPEESMFQTLTSEVTRLASSLNAARAAAEEEARLRATGQSIWTPDRLRLSVQTKLNGSRLFAISNREPYEHSRQGNGLVWTVPPSGLVTALEPVLRACDGTWVAQATGSADADAADAHGRLRVPPDHPQYTLRRVWLTKEEENGFYLGFANEGLWPLCHIAHTRPLFRAEDWERYQAVNRKFATALLEEMEGEKHPLVLAQDYHFALLPRMIKERRPDARVAIFWHIPWPNPEAFGICPWQRELLDGMLGADLIGFHIQAHCNNFLETVNRTLESRIDWEHFAVSRQHRVTAVRPFPISVAFGGNEGETQKGWSSWQERGDLLRQIGVEASFLGVGVDRVDYTKGIPERFRGIERLLEQYPSYQGKLTFVQIGAPSRTQIKRYQDLMTEVEQEADRINRRFRTSVWRPIVFLNRHHTHAEIQRFYRAADFCLVTSLHDGMNLVAKEYVAARQDDGGTLILSRFTGASHDLTDALVVNPYDTDELSNAVHFALTMPLEERQGRMRRMREAVREHNVYRWAGNLISELAGIRLDRVPEPAEKSPALAFRAPRVHKAAR